MSLPQHIGDLILPCPLGHLEIFTELPSSRRGRPSSGRRWCWRTCRTSRRC